MRRAIFCDIAVAKINTHDPSILSYYNGTHSEALGSCKLKLKNLANGGYYVQSRVPGGTISLIGVAAAEELEFVTVHTENVYQSATKEHPNKILSQRHFNRELF